VRPEDESSISDIDILPDGRLCVFGASQPLLEALEAVAAGDPDLRNRIDSLRTTRVQQPPELNQFCSIRNEETVRTELRR
jgi:hypothetical protein